MSDFQIYSSKFFWDFKRRDNVNYNFEVVEALLRASMSNELNEHREYFYKPIIITMTSIIECILYDFFIRIPGATREGIPNIDQKDIDLIKDAEMPRKLANSIEICKKYEFLGKKGDSIYQEALSFATKRNRIHIQNAKGALPADEVGLWTAPLVKACGKLLKDICQIMCDKYPRPKTHHLEPAIPRPISFPEPWLSLNH